MKPTNLDPHPQAVEPEHTSIALEGIHSVPEQPMDDPPIRPFALDDLSTSSNPLRAARSPDELALRIEFGTAQLTRSDVQRLDHGSVLQLKESSEAPIRVFVEDHLIALGDLVTRNGKLCVRILKLVPSPQSKAA